ncbi:hypothetical protein [Sodalis sp. dw_96]|uniref:endonuclease toxin domain-containing protein n=1 Tax=Sodalis sp. dw_96 TaxID=2719794 RepID=UPI002105C49C|nr:hypothetical protein [Sodalis sp. dw_96]
MDEVLTVYAYPPAGTKPQCEKNSDGVYTDVGGRLCEVGNTTANNIVSNYEQLNSITNNVEAFRNEQHTQKLINDAQAATAKLLANESARLSSQQQAVKQLVERQKINLNQLQAQSLQTRQSLSALQNKVQADFSIRQQRIQQNRSSITQHHSNIQTQFQQSLNRINSMPNPNAADRAKELQKEAERKAKAEMDRITEEHNRQIAEIENQVKVQEEEARRLEHEIFSAEHPLEAAQGWVNDAVNHINAMEHNKNHAEHLVRESEQHVQQITNEYNHLKAKVDGVRHRGRGPGGRKKSFVLDAIGNAMCIADWDRQLYRRMDNIEAAQEELNQRRTHLDHCHHQLHEAHQNKSRADANLGHVQNTIRQQQEAHAAHLAQLEAQRKAIEAAEARRQADAAKLKEQQEAQRKTEEAAKVVKALIATRAVENNDLGKVTNQFSSLSVSQQEQRVKELTTCQTNACKVQTEAKWFIQGADQWLSYSGGVAAGIPAGIVDGVKGVMHAAQNEREVYVGLKALVNSGNILGTVADCVKQSWIAHIDNMEASKQQGNVVGSFQAGIEGGKLTGDVLGLVASGAGIAKTVISVNKFGSSLPKIQTVSQAETGMVWGMGIQGQGMPWESFVGKQLPAGSRLPQNYKTFDYFDIDTGVAVSVKTIDTTTSSKIANPKQIYTSLKGNIDATISFDGYSLSGTTIKPGQITAREVIVAIPEATTKAQWEHINQAIKYGEDNGVTLKIIKVD